MRTADKRWPTMQDWQRAAKTKPRSLTCLIEDGGVFFSPVELVDGTVFPGLPATLPPNEPLLILHGATMKFTFRASNHARAGR